MEYAQIKQLMDDMGNSKLTSIDIDFPDGMKIKIRKENCNTVVSNIQVVDNNEIGVNTKEEMNETTKLQNNFVIKSPMVGTFYMKPTPTSAPYVEVGKNVKKGDIVCIIEAMKLMNEIESEYDGQIKEIFVKDGEAVEYGQALFSIA